MRNHLMLSARAATDFRDEVSGLRDRIACWLRGVQRADWICVEAAAAYEQEVVQLAA